MKAIVLVDNKWGIAKEGRQVVYIPDDLSRFRDLTLNHVIIYGRKTMESFPNQQPLRNRTNIVLSSTYSATDDSYCIISRSIPELMYLIEHIDDSDNCFVIGGESVYNQLLPMCDTVYVTQVEKDFEADKYFTNLNIDNHWKCIERGEDRIYQGLIYHYDIYRQLGKC